MPVLFVVVFVRVGFIGCLLFPGKPEVSTGVCWGRHALRNLRVPEEKGIFREFVSFSQTEVITV